MVNDNFILRDLGMSNAFDTVDLARHRWYFYKEGFSPTIVEKAIEYSEVKNEELILDPFNGSGTTTLTAASKGYNSIGIEVNPFTSYLSTTKIKNADPKDIEYWKSRIVKSISKGKESPLLNFSTFSKSEKVTKWLFNDDILNSFEGGWNKTREISSHDIKKIFRLALIISAMDNCNATRDGKCLRYRPTWENYGFNTDSFIQSFNTILENIKEDIEKSPITKRAEIYNSDCRTFLKKTNIKFKLCITSPPYLNTFDYTDIYRPELFLGKFVQTPQQLYNLRLKTVRSHIQAKWNLPKSADFGMLYKDSIAHVNANKDLLMHSSIPVMIQAYFEDMFNILKLLKSKALKNSQLWFIVSNSAYADKEIPVDLIIADIGSQAGWSLKEVGLLRNIKRRKTKYSPNISTLRESVIIFSNNK